MQTFLLKLAVYLFRKVTFKHWCLLEDKKYSCLQAVEDSSPDFPDLLADYLSTALYFKIDFSKISWEDTIFAFYKIHGVTSDIKKIPITSYKSEKKDKKDIWDYSGRLWYFYSNIIASAYGWSEKRIAKLDVSDALAYVQEILTERQLEKEFYWSTSEVAYVYDKATKKSKFSPMSRPYWMLPNPENKEKPKTASIPKSLLPVGNVINLYATKETKS